MDIVDFDKKIEENNTMSKIRVWIKCQYCDINYILDEVCICEGTGVLEDLTHILLETDPQVSHATESSIKNQSI